MLENKNTDLTEGIEYLRGIKSSYNPVKDKNDYTLEFIFNSLEVHELVFAKEKIIEMLIFDALIGNSDRHQENWGIITNNNIVLANLTKELELLERPWGKFKAFLKKIIIEESSSNFLKNIERKKWTRKVFMSAQKFSPIYDSGCCLGREYEEHKIIEFLQNEELIAKYILNGKSEVRINKGSKPLHWDVLKYIKEKHAKTFINVQSKVRSRASQSSLSELIHNLDRNLPDLLIDYKLSNNRKELMTKLITLRIETFLKF